MSKDLSWTSREVLFHDYYEYKGQVRNLSGMYMMEFDYFKEVL